MEDYYDEAFSNAASDVERKAKKQSVLKWLKGGLFGVLFTIVKDSSLPAAVVVFEMIVDMFQVLAFPFSHRFDFPWNSSATNWFVSLCSIFTPEVYVASERGWFLAALGLVGLILVDVVFVGYSFSRKSYRMMWTIKVLRTFGGLFSTILFIPLLGLLSGQLSCDHADDSGGGCGTGIDLLYKILSAVVCVLFFFLALSTTATFYDQDPKSKDVLARPHGRVDVFYLIVRTVLTILMNAMPVSNKTRWIFTAFCVVGSCSSALFNTWYIPYYRFGYAQLRCVTQWIFAYACLTLVLAMARNTEYESEASILFFLGIPLVVPLSILCMQSRRRMILRKRVRDCRDVYEVELRIRFALEKEGLLRPTEDDDDREKSEAEATARIATLRSINAMYAEAVKRRPKSSLLHVFWAHYYLFYLDNSNMALAELSNADELEPLIDEQFLIYRRQLTLSEAASQSSASGGVDVIAYIQYQKYLADATKCDRKVAATRGAFWTELLRANPNMARLHRLGSSMSAALSSAQENYLQLLKLNPSSPQVLRMYASFLIDVLNDTVQGDELTSKAESIEDARARAGEAEDHEVGFDDSNPTITISGAKRKEGTVLECNLAACRLLGYKRADIVGKNINMIIPRTIAAHHNRILANYLSSGVSTMLDRKRSIVAIHSNGYIVPANIVIRQALDPQGSTCFIGVMRPIVTQDHYIVTDPAGTILSCTSACAMFFESSIDEIEREQLHVTRWIPNVEEIPVQRAASSQNSAGNEKVRKPHVLRVLVGTRQVEYELAAFLERLETAGDYVDIIHFRPTEVRSREASNEEDVDEARQAAVGAAEVGAGVHVEPQPPLYPAVEVPQVVELRLGEHRAQRKTVSGSGTGTPARSASPHLGSREDIGVFYDNNEPPPPLLEGSPVDYPGAIPVGVQDAGRAGGLQVSSSVRFASEGDASRGRRSPRPPRSPMSEGGEYPYANRDSAALEHIELEDLNASMATRPFLSADSAPDSNGKPKKEAANGPVQRRGRSGSVVSDRDSVTTAQESLRQRTRNIIAERSSKPSAETLRIKYGLLSITLAIIAFAIASIIVLRDTTFQYTDTVDCVFEGGTRRFKAVTIARNVRTLQLSALNTSLTVNIQQQRDDLKASAESLRQQQTKLYTGGMCLTKTLEQLYLVKNIPMRMTSGDTSLMNLWEAVQLYTSKASQIAERDYMTLQAGDLDVDFVLHNGMTSLLTGLEASADVYEQQVSEFADELNTLTVALTITPLCFFIFVVIVVVVPALVRVEARKAALMEIFLDLPRRVVRSLVAKDHARLVSLASVEGDTPVAFLGDLDDHGVQLEDDTGVSVRSSEKQNHEASGDEARDGALQRDGSRLTTGGYDESISAVREDSAVRRARNKRASKRHSLRGHLKALFGAFKAQRAMVLRGLALLVVALSYYIALLILGDQLVQDAGSNGAQVNWADRRAYLTREIFFYTRESAVANSTAEVLANHQRVANLTARVEEIDDGLLYGSATLDLKQSARRPEIAAKMFGDVCQTSYMAAILPSWPPCKVLENGVLTSGLVPTIAHYSELAMSAMNRFLAIPRPFSHDAANDLIRHDPQLLAVRQLDWAYMTEPLNAVTQLYASFARDQVDTFQRLILILSIVEIFVVAAMWFVVFRSALVRIENEIRNSRAMLLMIPFDTSTEIAESIRVFLRTW